MIGIYWLAAEGSGAAVISVASAEHGGARPLLGYLTTKGISIPVQAIEVAVSPDGRYAFVTLEGAHEITVFDLETALKDHFAPSSFIGTIPLGDNPVGLAISSNGRWLYATSEDAAPSSGLPSGQGTLSVISIRRAETNPSGAVVATVTAGCTPVRGAVSPDGRTVWVTARGSNALLAFSASRLNTDPSHALTADVSVGQEPVALTFVDGGTLVVVTDSDRYGVPRSSPGLTIVNSALALAARPAVLGDIASGRFPRAEALEPNGTTLLVANYSSHQLEAVDLTTLDQSGSPYALLLHHRPYVWPITNGKVNGPGGA